MQNQRMNLQQQQALMQQALLQQQSLYHPGLLAPPQTLVLRQGSDLIQQIEPYLSGNLPPGFDPSSCRSVYVGNIHPQVTEALLQEVFAGSGPVEGCKLVRKEKSSYGFVHYYDRRYASMSILTLNGRHLDAKVMWDQKTGRSRGFGFVSFRNQQDAQSAINELTGKWLGSRQIRCNWATKGATSGDDKQGTEAKSMVEWTNGSSVLRKLIFSIFLEDGKENTNSEAPENNPQYTTVYVGNLPPEATQLDLHRHFYQLGAGTIEEVRVQRDKGFGFVRYSTHAEATLAIQFGNNPQSFLLGKQIKCSWGSKPTPPSTASNPLPPPAAPLGVAAIDLYSYERQLAMNNGLMNAPHPLNKANMGMAAAGGSHGIYDGGFQNLAAAQQMMYYH
ncbi:hypothetical protein KSS87_000084 [Heliosperma pusillum]|nr:hypothetical protein KSS87_000084 [Heliosperma pusillum]